MGSGARISSRLSRLKSTVVRTDWKSMFGCSNTTGSMTLTISLLQLLFADEAEEVVEALEVETGMIRAACRTGSSGRGPGRPPTKRGSTPKSALIFSSSGARLCFSRKAKVSAGTRQSRNCSRRRLTSGGMAARTRSISASSTGIGAESVSGYMRSGPGSTRSKMVRAVGQALARLVGHAGEGQAAALLDRLQGGLDVVVGGPEQHLGVVFAGFQSLAQRLENVLARGRLQLLGMEHVGLFQAGDDLQAVADLVGEHFPGLGEVGKDAPESGQVDGQQPQFLLLRVADRGKSQPRASASTSLAAIFQSLPSPRRRRSSSRISSSAFWRKASLCTSSGIQAMWATPLISTRVPPRDADVDVLAGGADAGAHLAGAARQEADVVGGLGRLVGGQHVGVGHGLDQRHAQAVGGIDARVADVGDLAAGVLLDAQLDDADLLAAERDLALDAQDAGALEAGGDAAVQVLLARDVELADDVAS